MEKKYCLLLILFLFLSTGCEEKEEYETVIVKGRVFDFSLSEPLVNQLVYVYDHGGVSMPWFYQNVLDSARTDANGYYELAFERKELHQTYVATAIGGFMDVSYVSADRNEGSFEVVGNGGTFNFNLKKTSVLRVRLKVINNPYPPLKVWGAAARIGNLPGISVHGSQNDTVFYLRGVPSEENVLGLEAKSSNGSYYRLKWEYFQLGAYDDTLNVTVVAEPNSFPITK